MEPTKKPMRSHCELFNVMLAPRSTTRDTPLRCTSFNWACSLLCCTTSSDSASALFGWHLPAQYCYLLTRLFLLEEPIQWFYMMLGSD